MTQANHITPQSYGKQQVVLQWGIELLLEDTVHLEQLFEDSWQHNFGN